MTFQYVQGQKRYETSREDLLTQAPYTIAYFYPKDNTPGCTVEAKEFSELTKEFADLDVQIIGISKDSLESHCSFIEKHTLRPIYLSDPELVLHKKYHARGEKNMYGKLTQGVIRTTLLLDTAGQRLKERHNVRAKGHAQKVLTETQKLLGK